MNKLTKLTMAGILLTGIGAAPALAKDGDVIRTGNCSAASDWKLKLSPENGKIEVEYEVDQNVSGDTWTVTLSRNGAVIFSGNRVTKGPSGSFEVRKVITNNAGSDTVTASALNTRTGETCGGSATATF